MKPDIRTSLTIEQLLEIEKALNISLAAVAQFDGFLENIDEQRDDIKAAIATVKTARIATQMSLPNVSITIR